MTVIKKKRDTAALWAANNPVLADGEHGVEKDTKRFKIGDGVTHWNDDPNYYIPDAQLKAQTNRWLGDQIFKSIAQRDGNKIDLTHSTLHPSSRSRATYFDGNAHPIGSYYSGSTPAARLANAQLEFPWITSEDDEADWVSLQSAVLAIYAYPKGWGKLDAQDWRQYGGSKLTLPLGVIARINKPIVKAANSNQNLNITSEGIQGARIDYVGTDGGRIFDLERDGVGSSLDISNLVLNGGGVRLKGPYRGDIRVGEGCLIVDAPHPAIMCVDTDKNAVPTQVGVVGLVVENCITHGCAGAVWQHSSTADITTVRDTRAICNMDVPFYVNGSTDAIFENIDATGLVKAKADLGVPYVQFSAEKDTLNNINLDDVRFGSEAFTAGTAGGPSGIVNFTPPRDYLLIGELDTDPTQEIASQITIRKCEFRSPPTVSATVANSAIRLNTKVNIDIDESDFGEFNSYLVHEDYLNREVVYHTGAQESFWGDQITIDAGHKGRPIFSHGGVGFRVSNRMFPTKIDRRSIIDPGDSENLVSIDLSTWTSTNGTMSSEKTGGLGGAGYYTHTKSAVGPLFSKTVALTAGSSYTFGITARRGAVNPARNFRARCSIGVNPILSDSRQIRLTNDWVTYLFRVEYVPTSATYTFAFFPDNDSELNDAQIDVMLPWVTKGLTPKPPRSNLRLAVMRSAPVPPIIGTHYLADGVNWDPKSRGLSRPYEVMYDGAGYEPVTAPEPSASAAPVLMRQTGGDMTLTPNDATNWQDIPGMSVALGVGVWRITEGDLEYDTSSVADIALRPNVGTSGMIYTGNIGIIGLRAAAVAVADQVNFGTIASGGSKTLGGIGAAGATTPAHALFKGTINVTTAGTLKLQAHQGSAEASTTIVRYGSIKFEKIA